MNRRMLRPLGPIYAAAAAARNLLYARGAIPTRRLPFPVISVGNLSTGGTGKTPLIIALVEKLASAGRTPIVLSRGYGRNANAPACVDPDGTAAQFGDEPLLIARRTSAPVYVGADRFAAGQLALAEQLTNPRTIFLLDDGFQHRRLFRNVDLVLVSPGDLTDRSLPAGNLRESLAALTRADALVFNESEIDRAPEFLSRFVRPSCGRPVLWSIRRSLDISGVTANPGPVVAFAAIAHPSRFFEDLTANGIELAAHLAFDDHHEYTFRDITRILARLRATGGRLLLTTEKDLVRLTPEAKAALQAAAPLLAVPLNTSFLDSELYLRQIEALIARNE